MHVKVKIFASILHEQYGPKNYDNMSCISLIYNCQKVNQTFHQQHRYWNTSESDNQYHPSLYWIIDWAHSFWGQLTELTQISSQWRYLTSSHRRRKLKFLALISDMRRNSVLMQHHSLYFSLYRAVCIKVAQTIEESNMWGSLSLNLNKNTAATFALFAILSTAIC